MHHPIAQMVKLRSTQEDTEWRGRCVGEGISGLVGHQSILCIVCVSPLLSSAIGPRLSPRPPAAETVPPAAETVGKASRPQPLPLMPISEVLPAERLLGGF